MSWRDWFIKERIVERPVYKIVEVKAPKTQLRWDNSTRESISTLQSHPGFIALTDKLALCRAQLETKNNRVYKKDLREADFLQTGIFWCSWLQEQVEQSTHLGSQKTFDAMDEELKAFQEINSQIERVCEQ